MSNIVDLLNKTLDSITDNESVFINYFPNVLEKLFENSLINSNEKNHPMIKKGNVRY